MVECRDHIFSLESSVAAAQEERSRSSDEQSKTDEILQIVRQLQAQSANMSGQMANGLPAAGRVIDEEAEAEETENDVCKEMTNFINELCVLIGDKTRTVKSDDGSEILEKL